MSHADESVLARSTIAVLNPWSFRQHSADGTATLTISYLVASRSHTVIHRLHRWGWRRMNAASQTAFRLSLLREPNARTGADRFYVQATSRTMCCSNCQRSVCAYFQRKWAGRRSNPRLRCFTPLLYRLSYQPRMGIGREKRPDVARDTGPFGKAPESDLCHKRKVREGAVFAGS